MVPGVEDKYSEFKTLKKTNNQYDIFDFLLIIKTLYMWRAVFVYTQKRRIKNVLFFLTLRIINGHIFLCNFFKVLGGKPFCKDYIEKLFNYYYCIFVFFHMIVIILVVLALNCQYFSAHYDHNTVLVFYFRKVSSAN